jgi:hypothetical protein
MKLVAIVQETGSGQKQSPRFGALDG